MKVKEILLTTLKLLLKQGKKVVNQKRLPSKVEAQKAAISRSVDCLGEAGIAPASAFTMRILSTGF